MTKWTSEELNKIGAADELDITTLHRDGTPRKPVTIWVVRVGDELYIRSYKGHSGAWYRATQRRGEGRILAGGVAKDVSFVMGGDPALNDKIDEAYRAKYGRYSQYVPPMLTAEARSTTIRLVPRGT